MIAFLRTLFRSKTLEEWKQFLADTDCYWSPVATVDEVMNDPQVMARGMITEMTDPQGEYGTVKFIASPLKLSETPARNELFPPRKGEHTREVLRGCGYSEEEIDKFYADGAV